MMILKKIFFILAFAHAATAMGSPSETNHFQLSFKGADADSFKSKQVVESSKEYGAQRNHIMHDYSLSFVKKMGDSGYKFVLSIECQQRVLDYRSHSPSKLAPTCSFTYFTQAPEDVTINSSLEMYTYIEMTPDISKRMIQELSWREHKGSGSFFFGCYDNKESGCPTIRYTPATGSSESLLEVTYYKP